MAKTSKFLLAEQIQTKLEGGYPDIAAAVQRPDLYKRIEQKVNGLFAFRHLSISLPSGETMPENVMIATYENNTVVSGGEISYAELPVQPISLTREMGVYLVYDPNFPDMPFIPLLRGQKALLRTDGLLSDIMGQISYERKNERIYFNKDLTLLGMTVVTMELCVFDISQYTESEYLPIPSDMEDRIIQELYEEFAGITPESGIVDKTTTIGNK